jgi:prepilin-type processing-associated H-X9-DG protein
MASSYGTSIFPGGKTTAPGDILNEKNTPADMAISADGIRAGKMNHDDYVNFLFGDGHVKGYHGNGKDIFNQNSNNGLSNGITALLKGLITS